MWPKNDLGAENGKVKDSAKIGNGEFPYDMKYRRAKYRCIFSR